MPKQREMCIKILNVKKMMINKLSSHSTSSLLPKEKWKAVLINRERGPTKTF